MRFTSIILSLLAMSITNICFAQENKQFGQFTGSLESNNAYYLKDSKLNQGEPEHDFGTNNYLKLNYSIYNFSAGLQYEAYLPPLLAYNSSLEGQKIIQGFLKYNGKAVEVVLGNFYEQFGNGLIYRSFEDRALGLNNSILGALVRYKAGRYFALKAFTGKPRQYLNYSQTLLSGIDGEISIDEFLPNENQYSLKLGGSFLHQNIKEETINSYPTAIDAFAGRLLFNLRSFNLSSEYVNRSKAQVFDVFQGYSSLKGEALLINTGYNTAGIGFNLSLRRLENMATRMENTITDQPLFINYLPALTRQHKYALANLYPHQTQANGEIGGQTDFYFDFPQNLLGGEYPEKLSLNFSLYFNLNESSADIIDYFKTGNELQYQDFNIEIEKKWNKKVKTNFMFMQQRVSRYIAEGHGLGEIKSEIIAVDMLYKFNRKTSLRSELQHSWSDSNEKNHLYGSAELGLSPRWMIFVNDLFAYSSSNKIHYYNTGFSFSKGHFRTALSYGRNRAGLQCSGGICRYMPAYSGLTLSLSATF